MVLILALIYGWDMRQIDFVLAYTQALAGNKYGDNLDAVLGTLEAILCFEAWLEEPTY